MLTNAENIFEKQQVVLQEINEIATARIDYNLKMARFFLKASPEMVKAFIIEMKILSREVTAWLKNLPEGPHLKSIRNSFSDSLQDDARFYLHMQKIISKGDDVQFTFDALHAWFSQQYIGESKKTAESKNSEIFAQFYEIHFFKSCMTSLESFISDVERCFVDEFDFSREFNPANNRIDFMVKIKPKSLIDKGEKLIKDFFDLYQRCKEEFGEKWHFEEMIDLGEFEKNRRSFISIQMYLSKPQQMSNAWLAYRELDEVYSRMQEEQKIIDEYIQHLRQEQNRLEAVSVNQSKPGVFLENKEEKQLTLIVTETEQPIEQKVEEPIRIVEKESKPDDYFALKTQEYKAKVERERTKKELLKRAARQEESRLLEKQKAFETAVLARKEERDRENAFQLLSGLNSHNFNLIVKNQI